MKTALFFLFAIGGYALTFLANNPKCRERVSHARRMLEAQKILEAHAKCTDCFLELCILSHDEAFYYCRTHDLIHLITNPIEVSILMQKIRALQQRGY